MSLMDNRHALAFGKNSLFLEVMEHLGLTRAWQGETNFWGSAVIGIEHLAHLRDVETICFDHRDDTARSQPAVAAARRNGYHAAGGADRSIGANSLPAR